jgi:hypothetical protein
MGVKMKTLLVLFYFFSISLLSQEFDSAHISANSSLVVKEKKVFTYHIPQKSSEIISTWLYDGNEWRNLSQDTMPTIHLSDSRCTFSSFSESLFVTGHYHLWEFDGKSWIKHAIYDSLYHQRRFEGIVELPDSSLLITAFTKFITGQSGNTTYIGKIFHEVLKFKNGTFTTVKSRWSYPGQGILNAYQKLKLNMDGTYTMFTMDESVNKFRWELVTYTAEGNIVRKDTIPNLAPFGFKPHKVEFNDYLFDSKGSLWFLTKTIIDVVVDENDSLVLDSNGYPIDLINFVGLVEITVDGKINFYNDNIGIEKSLTRVNSFAIDPEDNLWFFYSAQGPPNLYKLHADRLTLTSYHHNTMVKNSTIYNGGNTNFTYGTDGHKLLVYHPYNKSLFLTKGTPLLQFFPERVPATVYEKGLNAIQLYPNPVQSGNTITIESTSFEKVQNPLSIVIRDISGAVVRENVISAIGNLLTVKTDGLSRGTYFVSVLNNNKIILQTSFVKE